MNSDKQSFRAFCKENLIQEAGSSVKLRDLLQDYKTWMRYINISSPVPRLNTADIIGLMTEMYGSLDVTSRAFSNVRIMSEEEKELNSMKEELISMKEGLIRELATVDMVDAEEKRAITAAEQAKDLARYLDQQAFLATRKTARARAKYQDLQTEIVAKENVIEVLRTAVKGSSIP
jgi:hypothetical protein